LGITNPNTTDILKQWFLLVSIISCDGNVQKDIIHKIKEQWETQIYLEY